MKKTNGSGSILLGKFLRQLRGSRSLQSIEDLSKSPPLAGRIRAVDVSTLSKIETGKQYPSLQTLLSLEALYEVPIQRFLDQVKLERYIEYRPEGDDYDDALQEGYRTVALGDFQKAYAAFLRSEELAVDDEKRAVATNNKAGTLWKMGMLQEAINEYCGLLADLGLPQRLQVKALSNLSEVHRSRGNLFEARLHAQEGLRLAEGLGLRRSEAMLHATLANILDDLHEGTLDPPERLLREALRHHENSTAIFVELDAPADVAINRVNVGSIYCRLGNFIVGLKHLREGLAECERFGNRRNIAHAMKELGRAYYLTGNHQKAKDHLFDCERLSERQGYLDLLFVSYFYLREIELSGGGGGVHEYKRLLKLRPLQEGSFWELQQFDRQVESLKEGIG